jgi:RNA polymerase sigma factor (sigma-70 family)
MDCSDWILQAEATLRDLIVDGRWDEAFTHAYSAYYPQIAGFCVNGLTGTLHDPVTEGEDIAQQVFLEFLQTLKQGRFRLHIARVRTFLFDRARKRCVDRLRAVQRRNASHDIDVYQTDVMDPHPRPEDTVLDEEQQKTLWERVGQLREVDRTIVMLHYQGGLSDGEIASVLHMEAGNVRVRLSRALQRLREDTRHDD